MKYIGEYLAPKLLPRIAELQKKEKISGLTIEEEGELYGLIAFSDNIDAARLRQKEHLADKGRCVLTSIEIRQLQDYYRDKLQKEQGVFFESNYTHYSILEENSPSLEANNRSVELKCMLTKAKVFSLNSISDNPIGTFEKLVTDLPDNVPVYPTKKDIPSSDDISQLELFFLSMLDDSLGFTDGKPEGALSVYESIACLRDKVRTKKFILGLREEISKFENAGFEEIYLCDAGCGAIPILAISAVLSSSKVKCTALELNGNSAKIASKIINVMGLTDRISVINTDATAYIPNKEFDILVSETMHSPDFLLLVRAGFFNFF